MVQNQSIDPLAEVTRQERKILMASSAVGLAIDLLGIIPSKISTLGIDFKPSISGPMKFMLSLVILYFLAAFLIYAWHDYTSGRFARVSHISKELPKDKEYPGDRIVDEVLWWGRLTGKAARVRIAFDVLVPSLLAIVSIVVLWVP